MNRNDKVSRSQVNRQFIDSLGLKGVPVEKFRKKVLNNIPSQTEVRGNPYNQWQQRHTEVYNVGDIYDYCVQLIKNHNKKRNN